MQNNESARAMPLTGALNTRRACAYLDISVPTIHRLVKRGLIRPNRATRKLLFSVMELDRFLSKGQV